MAKTLKEIYGLREMAINVPDGDVASLRKVVQKAILNGDLPGEAMAWLPRKAKGTPSPDAPETSVAEPATPEKGKKKKAAKEKEPAPEPVKIPLDPGAKADIDRSASAWDKLGQTKPEPSPFKSNVKSAPMKGPEFDPMGAHPEYDMPNLGNEPKSATVDLKQKGDPSAPDWSAGKKPGALSRLFGKKAPKQFDANPYEFEPDAPAPAAKPGKPDIDKFMNPEEEPPGPDGQDAMDDLDSFLKHHKQNNRHVPKAKSGGKAAMDDLGDFIRGGKK